MRCCKESVSRSVCTVLQAGVKSVQIPGSAWTPVRRLTALPLLSRVVVVGGGGMMGGGHSWCGHGHEAPVQAFSKSRVELQHLHLVLVGGSLHSLDQ